MISLNVSQYVDLEVDVSAKELARDLSLEEAQELLAELSKIHAGKSFGFSVPKGAGDGDRASAERVIEAAYRVAKELPNLPREIADLFWYVHGRALA